MSVSRRHVRQRLALAIAAMLVAPAWAQSAPAGAVAATELDQVVVTGARPAGYAVPATRALGFDLAPRENPATVNVLTDDFLRDANATRLDDVLSYIPGVTLNENGGWTDDTPLIRGFSGTTVYLNGMRFGGWQPLPDNIERIEVTKGPAGLETGVAEPGGVVNIITKTPQRDFAAVVHGAVGDFGYRKAGGDITGALNASGTLQGRLVAGYEEGAEWRRGRPDRTPRWSITPSLRWEYAPDSQVRVEVERYHRDDAQDRGIIYLDGAWPGGFAPREWSFHQSNGRNEHDTTRAEVAIDHRFNATWSAALRYRHVDYRYRVNEFRNAESEPSPGDDDLYNDDGLSWNGNTVIPIYWAIWAEDGDQQVSQAELRGEFEAGSTRHEVLAGVEQYRKQGQFDSSGLANDNTIDIFELDNDQQPVFVGDDGPYSAVLDERIDSVSLRWLGRWSPRVRTVAGVRRDDARFEAFGSESASDTVSWRVAASFDLDARNTLFAGYSNAFVPQTGVSRSGAQVDPTRARSIEGGVKTALAGGRALWTNTVFRIRKDDIAASDPTNEDFESFVVPFGSAQVQGIESELSGQFGDNLRLSGGVALLDSEILDNPDGYTGNRFANTARVQASALASYRWAAHGLPGLRTTLGVVHVGQREGNSGNNLSLPAYTVLNLGAEYALSGRLSVNAFVSNAFDETYYPAMQDSGARADQVMIGNRRLVQAGFRYRF